MNKVISIFAASLLALGSTTAVAADAPKKDSMAKSTAAAMEKPADVSAEAWAKMTDAEKAKAVEKSKGAMKSSGAMKSTAAPKKEKKGGC
jgi:hypothetical protein